MTLPFTSLTAVAAPLLHDNVDTDAIIPSREMRTVGKSGLADGLFAGWRYIGTASREPDPDFVLNQPAFNSARILLAGANFGCGSSREHAAWALGEYGFRAIIAPSFNPIFFGNCVRNGIVPVTLSHDAVAALADSVVSDPQHLKITVDLRAGEVKSPGGVTYRFAIDAESREMLLEGLDPVRLTMRHSADIDAFIASDRARRKWAYCGVTRA